MTGSYPSHMGTFVISSILTRSNRLHGSNMFGCFLCWVCFCDTCINCEHYFSHGHVFEAHKVPSLNFPVRKKQPTRPECGSQCASYTLTFSHIISINSCVIWNMSPISSIRGTIENIPLRNTHVHNDLSSFSLEHQLNSFANESCEMLFVGRNTNHVHTQLFVHCNMA